MVDSMVSTVVEKLAGVMELEVSLLGGVREDLEYVKNELNTMNAFLEDDAEENHQGRAKVKKEWVKTVRELAYDAEDCIDEFNIRLQKPPGTGLVGRLRKAGQSIKRLRAHRSIAIKIQRIKTRAREASERAQRYGFTSTNYSTSSSSSIVMTRRAQHNPRQNALFLDDANIVGIQKPKAELIDWLLRESESRLVVISVVGPGGLGKTTLVKKVYESPLIFAGHFDCHIWMTISKSFNKNEFFGEMFAKLVPDSTYETDKMDEAELTQKIRDYLKDKRYFIILDDIWGIGTWQCAQLILPHNNNGSRVMVTTRNQDVANTCSSKNHKYIHKLEPLSLAQSRDLLYRKVFDGLDHKCPSPLLDLSEKILKKCGGLPLALVTIGGLLASMPNKSSTSEWQRLLDLLGAELETSLAHESMNRIFSLSFNALAYHLKKCFLYLSIFPDNYKINLRQLQMQWIAEGLVTSLRDMTMEDVAEFYVNELISRNLIQVTRINLKGNAKACQVHDMMLEFIISKSMEENLCLYRRDRAMLLPTDANRRLSIQSVQSGREHSLARQVRLSHVRSFAAFYSKPKPFLSSDLKLLRVLNLDGCIFARKDDLEVLGEFLHLKYLSLRNTSGTRFPSSIGKLRNLEIIDYRGVYHRDLVCIPTEIINLKKLQYILCSSYQVHKLPRGIGTLTKLKVLPQIDLDATEGLASELGELTQLRNLEVKFSNPDVKAEVCASISKLSGHLRSLTVDSFHELGPTVNNITSPPQLLETLVLRGVLRALPGWVAMLSNLFKLSLSGTEVGDDNIKVLSKLPNLHKLWLAPYEYNRIQLRFGPQGFACLKVLALNCGRLRSLRFEVGAMPNLEEFEMWSCNIDIANDFGLEHLASLKLVTLEFMQQKMVDTVRDAVEAHPRKPRFEALYTRASRNI